MKKPKELSLYHHARKITKSARDQLASRHILPFRFILPRRGGSVKGEPVWAAPQPTTLEELQHQG